MSPHLRDDLVVPDDRVGLELDEFLALTYPLLGKGYLRAQVRAGNVLVDGRPAQPSHHLRRDQVVSVDLDEASFPKEPVAPAADLPVLYEDEAVLVVDKPPGLAVEPERWRRDAACVSGALLALARERAEAGRAGAEGDPGPEGDLGFRPRLVHRIDKGTSGALLVAKTLEVERGLRQAFEEGRVHKRYLALVEGEHPASECEWEEIDEPVASDPRKSGRMCVAPGGKPSRTRVSVAERFRGYTLLACEPVTGRTHQIRVHLAHMGFPLAVDSMYGRRSALKLSELKRSYKAKRGGVELPLIERLTLHAARIEFPDLCPTASEGATIEVEAALPKDFQRVLKQLRKVRGYRS